MPRTIKGKYVTEAAQVFQNGDDFWHAGQYDEARDAYKKAAVLYKNKDDTEGEAFALMRLGELELSIGHHKEAESALLKAVELTKDFDFSQNTYGEILINLAKVELAKNDVLKANYYLKEAQAVLVAIDNKNLLGDAFDQQGYLFLLENKQDEAVEAYKKAAVLYKNDGISLKEASVLRAIARIEMKNHNYDIAHDVLEECRDLYRENGDLLGEASALSAIGCLRYIIRDIENARKALMKSVYLYGKAAHHFAEAESLLYLARVEAYDKQSGDFERAKAHYKRAIDLFGFLENDTMKNSVLNEYNNFLNRIAG